MTAILSTELTLQRDWGTREGAPLAKRLSEHRRSSGESQAFATIYEQETLS